MDTIHQSPVQLTDTAATQVKKLLQGAAEAPYLRVGIKGGGGCSGGGVSYILGFDARMEDDDLFEVAGIPVIMKKAHGIYLMGMEIDYHPEQQGFIFRERKP